MIYIGIDPGKKGGVAVVYDDNSAEAFSLSNRTLPQIWKHFQGSIVTANAFATEIRAAIEKVGGYVPRGEEGDGQPGSRMFEFGRSHGQLESILVGLEISYEHVHPNLWQRGVGLPPKSKNDVSWKNVLKQHAQTLFPDVKVTLATADALLIAWWLKITTEGRSKITRPVGKKRAVL